MAVWGVYFSPTDTGRKAVRYLAKGLKKLLSSEYKEYNFTYPEKRQAVPFFESDDIVFLCLPTVEERLPVEVLPYLEKMEGNGALGVAVVMYGNRKFGDSLMELKLIMKDRGFKILGAASLAGEHSFSNKVGKRRPDKDDLLEMDGFISDLFEKIPNFKEEDFFTPGRLPLGKAEKPLDRYGKVVEISHAVPDTYPDKCVHCGLCASVCPLGSISFDDFCTIEGPCMRCCACVKRCPTDAKYFKDESFLYYKGELEEMYGGKRLENQFYL